MKTKRTRINQREYDTIKQLLSLGLKVSQVVAVTKRSDSTIKAINKSTDMPNYLETIRNYVPKNRRTETIEVQASEPVQEVHTSVTTPTIEADKDWFADMLQEVRNTNKLLAMLVNNARMNKKGWFK